MKKAALFLCIIILFFSCFVTDVSAEKISVSAKAAILVNAKTGEKIFAKNANQRLPMASTTKIMTALILAEQTDLSKTIVTTKEMVTVEGSSMGLLAGDTVSYKALLYGMLLASGNDAANTAAIALGGTLKGFAELMNKKALELGMKNTNFVTPSGLDDEAHYTTAYDLSLLASAALKNKVFCDACSSQTATVSYGNPPYNRVLSNHNKLLKNYSGAIGLKTGFTKKAGRCLVSAAERDGVTLVAVTLNAPDDWQDHCTLLDYGFLKTQVIPFDNSDIADTLPVICGDCDMVKIKVPNINISITADNNELVERKVKLPKFIYSKLSAGEKVGQIDYYLKDNIIASVDVISLADVNIYNKKISFIKRLFNNIIFLISFL